MQSKYAWLTGTAVLYVLLALAGSTVMTIGPAGMALLWLPAGVALIMCQRFFWQALPFIAIASLVSHYGLFTGLPWSWFHLLLAAVADCLLPLLAVIMLRRFLPSGLTDAGSLFPFTFFVVVLPTAVASLLAGVNLHWAGIFAWDHFMLVFRMLWLAQMLGIILLYPLYMDLSRHGLPSNIDVWQMLLSAVVVVIGIHLSYSAVPGMIHLLLPFLLSLAFTDKKFEVLSLLLLAVVILLLKSAQSLGPFAIADETEGVFMLMMFMLVLCLLPLGLLLYKQELKDSIASHKVWQQRAGTDALTGLYNRHYFMPILNNEHQRSRRHHRHFSLAIIDIDDFKVINDTRGHSFGDKVLRALAGLLQSEVRNIDVVCRYGGEEFCMLFPETRSEYAVFALQRLGRRLQDKGLNVDGETVPLRVSIGLACYEGGDESVDQLIERADQFMYQAKAHDQHWLVSDTGQFAMPTAASAV
jgi:diguanylate cyclase (GGDEF)-like protein